MLLLAIEGGSMQTFHILGNSERVEAPRQRECFVINIKIPRIKEMTILKQTAIRVKNVSGLAEDNQGDSP